MSLNVQPGSNSALHTIAVTGREDVAGNLPNASRAKLARLRRERDDAHALLRIAEDERRESLPERRALRDQLAAMRRPRSEGGLGSSDHEIEAAERGLSRLDAEVARLENLSEERRAKWDALSRLVSAIEDRLKNIDPGDAVPYTAARPKLSNAENIPAAVERVRDKISGLRAVANQVASAPLPLAEAKAAMRAQIDALAERGKPDLSGLFSADPEQRSVKWPSGPSVAAFANVELVTATRRGGGGMPTPMPDALALIAWLHRTDLKKKLAAELDVVGDDANALGDADRRDRLAEIERNILAAEREEEALIAMGEASGLTLARRPDANPFAVLELELRAVARAAA